MSNCEHTQNQSVSFIENDETTLSTHENECERMIHENLTNGQNLYSQKLFLAFQNAAKNLTKMFRERSNGTNNWNTFHATAESVTLLYKESLDALKDAIQLGIINGEQHKAEEVLRWTHRKQHRHIRSEEIFDYLVDRSPYLSTSSVDISSTGIGTTNSFPIVDDLQTFRQALVMDDNDNKSHVNTSTNHDSEQLENFVRQQVANQLARKRDFHSTDLSVNDLQKLKRARYM